MEVHSTKAESQLINLVRGIKGDAGEHYGLHFRLSRLQDEYRSAFQLKIAANILADVFRHSEGAIFICRDGDIFLIYHDNDKALIEKAIFQVRYLFMDDSLATNVDGTDNDAFCAIYDLSFQWRAFHRLCADRMSEATRAEEVKKEIADSPADSRGVGDKVMTPSKLVKVVDMLDKVDFVASIRSQPICAKKPGKDMKVVYNEIYVNISHLSALLGGRYDLMSDKGLFQHLTCRLDEQVLSILEHESEEYLSRSASINLNVSTILSRYFQEFTAHIKKFVPSTIVLELNVADVLTNLHEFKKARDVAHASGYRICLDGLNNLSFIQVDCRALGFDLAKLQWNADLKGDLGTPQNQQLAKAIEKVGSNRIILCWCDSGHAVEYGHALGISLFQGRYIDRVIDPDATIVN